MITMEVAPLTPFTRLGNKTAQRFKLTRRDVQYLPPEILEIGTLGTAILQYLSWYFPSLSLGSLGT